jgi:hypothetical protein
MGSSMFIKSSGYLQIMSSSYIMKRFLLVMNSSSITKSLPAGHEIFHHHGTMGLFACHEFLRHHGTMRLAAGR